MVKKKDIHVRKYQSIGWRGAEVTITESAIINNNDSYFVTRCTTSNLIKSRVFLQTSLLDTTRHPQTCNVSFQKISIPPKEGNRIFLRGCEAASPGLFPGVPYKIRR